MTNNDELERAQFEAWIMNWWPQTKGNLSFIDGNYTNNFVDYAWQGWLARSKQEAA